MSLESLDLDRCSNLDLHTNLTDALVSNRCFCQRIHVVLYKELEMEPFYIANLTFSGESK